MVVLYDMNYNNPIHDILSVQPMSAHIGIKYYIKYRFPLSLKNFKKTVLKMSPEAFKNYIGTYSYTLEGLDEIASVWMAMYFRASEGI